MNSTTFFRALLPFLPLLPLGARAQLGPDSLRFAIIADPQYADKASNGSETVSTTRCYRGSVAKLTTAISFFNARSPAFLMMLGDYIDGYTAADYVAATRDVLLLNAELNKFQGDVYQVMGNHDEQSLNKDEWLNLSVGKVKRNYYSFDAGPIHFVVLDGNYTQNGKDYGRVDPWTWTDTWILAEQKAWLIADLDSAGQKPTIVNIHQNIHDQTDYSLRNSTEIRQILETHGNVTHVLQGHRHEGAYARVNGIHYVTFQAMLNCPMSPTGSGNNYSLAVIRDSALYLDGYGSTPDRVLTHPGLLKAAWTTGIRRAAPAMESRFRLSGSELAVLAGGSHEIRVQDARGRLVAAQKGAGARSYSLDRWLAGKQGVYLVTVRTAAGTYSNKVIRF